MTGLQRIRYTCGAIFLYIIVPLVWVVFLACIIKDAVR